MFIEEPALALLQHRERLVRDYAHEFNVGIAHGWKDAKVISASIFPCQLGTSRRKQI